MVEQVSRDGGAGLPGWRCGTARDRIPSIRGPSVGPYAVLQPATQQPSAPACDATALCSEIGSRGSLLPVVEQRPIAPSSGAAGVIDHDGPAAVANRWSTLRRMRWSSTGPEYRTFRVPTHAGPPGLTQTRWSKLWSMRWSSSGPEYRTFRVPTHSGRPGRAHRAGWWGSGSLLRDVEHGIGGLSAFSVGDGRVNDGRGPTLARSRGSPLRRPRTALSPPYCRPAWLLASHRRPASPPRFAAPHRFASRPA